MKMTAKHRGKERNQKVRSIMYCTSFLYVWEFSPYSFVSLSGDYKATGRDCLVFLVDASKEMFIKGEDGEPTNFDMTMQVSNPSTRSVSILHVESRGLYFL